MTAPPDRNPQLRPARVYRKALKAYPWLATTATSNGELGHVDLRAGTHNSALAGLTDALSSAITTAHRAGAPPSHRSSTRSGATTTFRPA